MHSYASNHDFYNHIDSFVSRLLTSEHSSIGAQVHYLLHKVAWTSATELFAALRNKFVLALESPVPLRPELADELRGFIEAIDSALGGSDSAV